MSEEYLEHVTVKVCSVVSGQRPEMRSILKFPVDELGDFLSA
jgi:hypothetical protein